MENDVKEIELQRSESFGFGFSIIGGSGSELPPAICDIVENSPAYHCEKLQAGDVIVAVNNEQVFSFTTKEVLKCLRLSGPLLKLTLQEDPVVKQKVENYLSNPDDGESLRDFISQRDLTGVDEIIVRCQSSPLHSPRHHRRHTSDASTASTSASVSPSMPKRMDRDVNGGAKNTRSPSAAKAHKALHENGFDGSSGTGNGKVDSADQGSPSKRSNPGFETFVMTGDMIIRTTSSHSSLDRKKKQKKDGGSKIPVSPERIQQHSTPKKEAKKPVSRIPKPQSRGSPRHTPKSGTPVSGSPRQIRKPQSPQHTPVHGSPAQVRTNKMLSESANVPSTDSESLESTPSHEPTRIENLEQVNNNVVPLSTANVEEMSRILQEGATCQDFPNEYDYYTHYSPMYSVMSHELDIPPDDISSEDDNYRNLDNLINLDDLPPPPDELLHDFFDRSDELVGNEEGQSMSMQLVYSGSNQAGIDGGVEEVSWAQEVEQEVVEEAMVAVESGVSNAGVAAAADVVLVEQQSAVEHAVAAAGWPGALQSGAAAVEADQTSSPATTTAAAASPSAAPTGSEEQATAILTTTTAAVFDANEQPAPTTTTQPQDVSSHSPNSSMVTSKSAEKITHHGGANSQNLGVRTSKSHENYLESNAENVTLVDIDFEDNIASSVDVLHYHERSNSSIEQACHPQETSRSLETSPERKHDKHTERIHMPTFISLEEPRSIARLKEPTSSNRQRDVIAHSIDEVPEVEGGVGETVENEGPGVDRMTTESKVSASDIEAEDVRPDMIAVDNVPNCHVDHLHNGDHKQTNHVLQDMHYGVESSQMSSQMNHTPHRNQRPNDSIQNASQTADLGSPILSPAEQDRSSPHRTVSPQISSSPQHSVSSNGASPHRGIHTSSHSSSSHGATSTSPEEGRSPVTSPSRSLPSSPEGVESDSDSLYHQPMKDVDRPSAIRLAKRLFQLDGFRKCDISVHLCKKNDFAQLVGEEYLKYFDFTDSTLDVALRKFLTQLTLAGETQERERVLAHFSKRYMECNPGTFNSEDACHTLTCAIMLLNTDLHGQNIGRKMTCAEFIENLVELNDGENFPQEVLRQLYHAIKAEPIEFEYEEEGPEFDENGVAQRPQQQGQGYIGPNVFLEIPDPHKATEYKKGYVMRKCCIDPDGRKTPLGKRGWKMYYAVLKDMILYLHKDEHAAKKSTCYENLGNAVRIHHALATRATDYTKKQHVFRLQTADWAQYLLQTSDIKECQEWIDTINFVAASLSAPPLPGGCGSQRKFQKPLMPSSYTKLNMREQLSHHEQRVLTLEQDLHEHRLHPPDKGVKTRLIQDYKEKEAYLEAELRRFKTYTFLLQAKMSNFPELEPSLVEVAIGEVEEPPSPPSVHSPPANKEDKDKRGKPVQRSMSDSAVDTVVGRFPFGPVVFGEGSVPSSPIAETTVWMGMSESERQIQLVVIFRYRHWSTPEDLNTLRFSREQLFLLRYPPNGSDAEMGTPV